MPYTEKEIIKIHWSIGEIARELGTEPFCIRFWEKEFGITVQRDHKGNRYYDAQDRALIHRIYRLLKVELYSIDGVRRQLALSKERRREKFEEEALIGLV